jgi:hypothetical protein
MLSDRGQKYLASLSRDRDWTSEKEIIQQYLLKNGIKEFVGLVDFQIKYSGYTLSKRNKPTDSFTARLLSQRQMKSGERLDYLELDNKFLIQCGDHKTAQFNFYLTHLGEFCTIDDQDKVNILSSSFDKEVERYAIHNQFANWIEDPYYYDLGSIDNLNVLTRDFQTIEECSDPYCSWWTDEKIMVIKGTWLDRAEFYIHAYGRSEPELNKFIERIKKDQIIKIAAG